MWDGMILMLSDQHYVKDGKFYWLDPEGFHIREAVSGQDQIYPWETEHLERYILVDNLLFSTSFRLMDLEKSSMELWSITDDSLKQLHELYTDGSQIYAIAGNYASEVNKNSVLRRVQVTQGEHGYEVSFETMQR